MVTNAQKEATKRYEKKVYDSLRIRTRRDDLPKEAIQASADRAKESLNAYVINAVKERMRNEIK